MQYYGPDYELDVKASNMDNANSPEYLEKIKNQVIENLKRTTFAPSVQMTDVPRDPEGMDDEADAILDDMDEDENKDTRYTRRRWDKYTEKEGELSESEDEAENERHGVRRQPGRRGRRNIMDYQNPHAVSDDEKSAEQSRAPSRMSQNGIVIASSAVAAGSAANGANLNGSPNDALSPRSGHTSPGTGANARQDEDVNMTDEPVQHPSGDALQEVRAQEATPPASPPGVTGAQGSATMANGDQVMTEADSPEDVRADDLQEREQEITTAEPPTVPAEESEQL
jgi:histone deacetylase 1/2